jgi:drug/metabolite transporter (DMT)-like permease
MSPNPADASQRRGLSSQAIGVLISFSSAIVVGWAPIFGKMAFRAGVDPFTLVALRTSLAAGLLWVFYLLFWRKHIRIGWHNLLGCIGMGAVNGIGSVFYYTGLQKLDASLASLLYTLYPIWVFIFLSASGHEISRLAFLRLGLALVGLYLVTSAGLRQPNSLGVMLMLASAAAYGWHLVLGQWVLADISSRTVALYMLTTMAAVVVGVRVAGGIGTNAVGPNAVGPNAISLAGWEAVAGLAVTTALSRLLMFAGLQRLGGVQTALLGISELVTSLLVAFLVLGDRLTLAQWVGATIIISSALLVSREKAAE